MNVDRSVGELGRFTQSSPERSAAMTEEHTRRVIAVTILTRIRFFFFEDQRILTAATGECARDRHGAVHSMCKRRSVRKMRWRCMERGENAMRNNGECVHGHGAEIQYG